MSPLSRGQRRGFVPLPVVLILLLLVSGCGGDDAPQDDAGAGAGETETGDGDSGADEPAGDQTEASVESVELSITTTLGGPDGPLNIPASDWLDAVEEASGGAMTYQFYYTNSLVPPGEIGQALGDGTVDLALMVPAYTPDAFPIDTWLSKLAFLSDVDPPAGVLQEGAALLEWWYQHPEAIEADFTSNGIVPLTAGLSTSFSYDLICNDPVTTLAEARGKQVRTGGQAWAEAAEALGMTPVTVPGAEMYEALQRGVVDCVMTSADNMVGADLWSVANHYTRVGFPSFVSWGLYMSERAWSELSDAQKQILWDNLPVYLESFQETGMDGRLKFYGEEGQEKGLEYHEPDSEFMETLRAHEQAVLERAKNEAPAGISDPAAAVESLQELYDKWGSVVVDELEYPIYDTWVGWASSQEATNFDARQWASYVFEDVLADRRP